MTFYRTGREERVGKVGWKESLSLIVYVARHERDRRGGGSEILVVS